MGRALQLLFSRSPYRDIAIPWAPFYASDWDSADLFPSFLQFFVYKPNLIHALSSPHNVRGGPGSGKQFPRNIGVFELPFVEEGFIEFWF